MGARWWDGSDEPLGVVAALMLIWLAWGQARAGASLRNALLGVSLYGLLRPWAPDLVCAAVAMLTLAATASPGKIRPGWLALALLSLPSLASLQFFLGYPARLAAAQCAAWWLGAQGYDLERRGVELVWGQRHLLVDTPCSGLAMLWMMVFFAASLAAIRDWSLWTTVRMCLLAGLVAWFVNVMRLTGLFYTELVLGRPELHTAMGVLAFVLGIALLARLAPPSSAPADSMAQSTAMESGRPSGLWIVAPLVALLGMVGPSSPPVADFPGWPTQWQGESLQLLEEVTVAGFPGRIGRFRCGSGPLLLRWVARPTRWLHSSADCFRAQGRVFVGVEQIYDADGRCFSDVSQWFWAASLGQSRGPWVAATRPSRDPQL